MRVLDQRPFREEQNRGLLTGKVTGNPYHSAAPSVHSRTRVQRQPDCAEIEGRSSRGAKLRSRRALTEIKLTEMAM
jgi:hypothetical protein